MSGACSDPGSEFTDRGPIVRDFPAGKDISANLCSQMFVRGVDELEQAFADVVGDEKRIGERHALAPAGRIECHMGMPKTRPPQLHVPGDAM